MKKTYSIEVDCANCANKMELATRKVNGVADASISFMTLKMNVEFEEGADEKATMKQVLKACRKIEDDCEIYF
ncbi:cation transporter [uncultured Eubacterium sp.]|uniref:cation transporter n=1 Tax=uncultured Eubacterium sp. TaxID=165185 RepID=UPI0015B8385C|nr:cation transporter [uncultured Eubacterium sp.]